MFLTFLINLYRDTVSWIYENDWKKKKCELKNENKENYIPSLV